MNSRAPSIRAVFIAEMIGTFILIFFGLGAVHTAVLMGAQSGIWQVAIVWAVAIIIAIHTVGGVSGAHINPAISIALAFWGKAPWSRVPVYIAGQLAGAGLAATFLFVLFQGEFTAMEAKFHIRRGAPESVITASCYGEFYPNPGGLAKGDGPLKTFDWPAMERRFSHSQAFMAELVGTLLLALVVFAVTDPVNPDRPGLHHLAPLVIGLTVAVLISVLGPLTQACFNPARDFAPRVVSYFAGWGTVALPGPNGIGFLTVYIIAPIVGACLGGGVYFKLIQPALREKYAHQSGSTML